MDVILSFLAKPVDKHGITLEHITYPTLDFYARDSQIVLKIIIIAELFIIMTISPG